RDFDDLVEHVRQRLAAEQRAPDFREQPDQLSVTGADRLLRRRDFLEDGAGTLCDEMVFAQQILLVDTLFEHGRDLAELQLVAGCELDFLVDALAVAERAEAAPRVLDEAAAVLTPDARVMPRHAR